MPETARLLISTVFFRPYVFVFLLIYLIAASLKLGPKRAVIFTLSAWAIAYVSEFSSVRTGVPFGMYHYIPSTTNKELWVFGVPFMDSLSFTFLAYSGWSTATVLLPRRKERFSMSAVLLGALLFMLIDVVIDPLSLRGDRWFLGKIYYYPEPGAYFGVTIANFIGWFIVGLVTLLAWGMLDRRMESGPAPDVPALELWGPALYYIVLIFNLAMTFWIGEYVLGLCGALIFTPLTALLFFKLIRGTSEGPPGRL